MLPTNDEHDLLSNTPPLVPEDVADWKGEQRASTIPPTGNMKMHGLGWSRIIHKEKLEDD